jgi:hypothetical protein
MLARFAKGGHSGLSLERGLSTARLRTHIPEDIPLPVQTGDKHGPAVLFAAWLVAGDHGRLVPSWSRVAQGFAEATLAELIGAAEKLHRIVDVEWGKQELHRPIMLVAQRQDVGPHGPSLASAAKQNPRTEPRVFDLSPWRTGADARRSTQFSCCRLAASA